MVAITFKEDFALTVSDGASSDIVWKSLHCINVSRHKGGRMNPEANVVRSKRLLLLERTLQSKIDRQTRSIDLPLTARRNLQTDKTVVYYFTSETGSFVCLLNNFAHCQPCTAL